MQYNFNTSHVNVNLIDIKAYNKKITTFQYISC